MTKEKFYVAWMIAVFGLATSLGSYDPVVLVFLVTSVGYVVYNILRYGD